MNMNDLCAKDKLDTLLRDWHQWQMGYSPVPVAGASVMFRNVKSGKGWDTTDEVIDDELNGSTMEAIDCQVNELPDVPLVRPYRSAIYNVAKNLHAGAAVWGSPRLPKDAEERAIVVMEARNMLTRRLIAAGVML